MRKLEGRGALFTHFEKEECNGRSPPLFHWRCKGKPNAGSSAFQVLSFLPERVALARALCLGGEVSSICFPISSRCTRSNQLICHCPFAPAWLHRSHNHLSSHSGSAHAGAREPCSSPPRRAVRVGGAAVVSLGTVARPAPLAYSPWALSMRRAAGKVFREILKH